MPDIVFFCLDLLVDPLYFSANNAFLDIVALLVTLSWLGQTYWTHLSTWKWPWKRRFEIMLACFFWCSGISWCGAQVSIVH